MSEIRLGFVGVGSMGQAAHLRNYATLADCKVVAIAEKRPLLAAEVARRYGVDRIYDGYETMLENEALDGIVAIQPFELHAQNVPRLLRKGVPVLTEKPLAATFVDGQSIVAAVNASGAPLYLAYHKRSDPAVTYAKRIMSAWRTSGEAGALRYLRVMMPPGDWSVQAFASNVSTGESFDAGLPAGGWDDYATFVNYYIHQVNLIRFLLDEDYDVEFADAAGITMTVRSRTGVVAVLEMAPYSTSLDWHESALICFETGWIRIDLPAPMVIDQPGRVTIYCEGEDGPNTSSPSLIPWHAMRCQAASFLAAIRGESHPLCSAADGLKDLEVAMRYIAKRDEGRGRSATG